MNSDSMLLFANKYKILSLALFLFVLYYMQGILYTSGSLISQSSIFLFLLLGLFFYIRSCFLSRKPFCVTIWIFFFMIQALYFIFSPKMVFGALNEFIGSVSTFDQFKGIATFSLTFFIAYYVAQKIGVSDNFISQIGLILICLTFIRFFYMTITIRTLLGREDFTNNVGYMMLTTVPYLPILFKRYKFITVLIFFAILTFIFLAAKRGAIISLISVIIFTLFYYLKKNRASIKSIIIILISCLILSVFVYYQYMSNVYLQFRLIETLEGDSSNRDIAYSQLLSHWLNDSNPVSFLFGNGMAYSIVVWGNYAHNDWLELLINNGLFGACVYFLLIVSLWLYIRKSSFDIYSRLAVYLCLIIWGLKSLFSMGYMDINGGIYILLLGLLIGNDQQKNGKRFFKNTLLYR